MPFRGSFTYITSFNSRTLLNLDFEVLFLAFSHKTCKLLRNKFVRHSTPPPSSQVQLRRARINRYSVSMGVFYLNTINLCWNLEQVWGKGNFPSSSRKVDLNQGLILQMHLQGFEFNWAILKLSSWRDNKKGPGA